MNIRVKWTGSYPNLCYGEWILIIDGEDKSNLIPEDLKDRPMNTFGIYSKWRFLDRENWEVVLEEYEDGMECNE